jgi:hypothetical protein
MEREMPMLEREKRVVSLATPTARRTVFPV